MTRQQCVQLDVDTSEGKERPMCTTHDCFFVAPEAFSGLSYCPEGEAANVFGHAAAEYSRLQTLRDQESQ